MCGTLTLLWGLILPAFGPGEGLFFAWRSRGVDDIATVDLRNICKHGRNIILSHTHARDKRLSWKFWEGRVQLLELRCLVISGLPSAIAHSLPAPSHLNDRSA